MQKGFISQSTFGIGNPRTAWWRELCLSDASQTVKRVGGIGLRSRAACGARACERLAGKNTQALILSSLQEAYVLLSYLISSPNASPAMSNFSEEMICLNCRKIHKTLQEMVSQAFQISYFSGGACSRTPLEICASGAGWKLPWKNPASAPAPQ